MLRVGGSIKKPANCPLKKSVICQHHKHAKRNQLKFYKKCLQEQSTLQRRRWRRRRAAVPERKSKKGIVGGKKENLLPTRAVMICTGG